MLDRKLDSLFSLVIEDKVPQQKERVGTFLGRGSERNLNILGTYDA
jgi:hypothetical protein